jgi:2-polyprenyl-6-methoxyphenol hydroxylase-like FAD-dependent oxidoreductase
MTGHYDAVVVGGSLAGCATARLLGLRGARVALVEKHSAMDAYKVVCGHYIQAGATPSVARLGLEPLLREAGAVPNKIDIWTRHGWIHAPANGRHGWNLRRSALDPMLRHLAADTPGVEYMPGLTATGVEGNGRITGVRVRDRHGDERTLAGRVVVAADGRDSTLARLARVPGRVRPHGRFGYFAYFEDIPLKDPHRSLMWLQDPDVAYIFPNEHGVSGVTVMPRKSRLAEFRGAPESAVLAEFARLPDAPDLTRARRVSKWIGKIEMPNVRRPAAARGVAFVGDAAQASDPVWGIGCGWAFQSAEWLAEQLGAALQGSDEDVATALDAYRERHRRELGAHHFMTSDYSSGRRFSPIEHLLFSGGARDPRVAEWMEEMGTRSIQPYDGMARTLMRAVAAGGRPVAA